MQIQKKYYFLKSLLLLFFIFNLFTYTVIPLYGQSSTCKCVDGKVSCTNCNPTCIKAGEAAACMGGIPLCCDENGIGTNCTSTITCGAGNTVTSSTPTPTPSSPCSCKGSTLSCNNCNPVCMDNDNGSAVACRLNLPLCCDQNGAGNNCSTSFTCGAASTTTSSSSSSSGSCTCISGNLICTQNCNPVCRDSGFDIMCRIGIALCCNDGGAGTVCNENYICTTSSGAFSTSGVFCSMGNVLCNEGLPSCNENEGEKAVCGSLLGFTGELRGPGCLNESSRFFNPGTVFCKAGSAVLPAKKNKCKKAKQCPAGSKKFSLCRFNRLACKCSCPFNVKKTKHFPVCSNKDILNCSRRRLPACVNPSNTAYCDKGKLYCKDITTNIIDLLDEVECKRKF